MDMTQVAANAGGIFSSIFLIASYTMTTMIPLRIFGILMNLVLITFSFTTGNYPTMLLHMVLLPLNSYRLHQMLTLVRDVKKSVHSDLSMAWLKPFMTERQCQAGEVLFYKDEKAEEMFYIVSGRYRLVEMGMDLPVGTLVGEMGMLSPNNKRTGTLECIESGLILGVTYRQVEELYVQNPAFGFYFLRLVSARLFENLHRAEARVAELTAAAQAAQVHAANKPA
jgi:CRP-like cAMP-binding protein